MDIKNKPTLEEKQAFWAEQLPNFEAKYWLPSHFELLEFDMEGGNYEVRDVLPEHYSEDDADDIYHRVNSGWAMWKKAINFTKAQVPESNALLSAAMDAVQKLGSGDFVLVPTKNIKYFSNDGENYEIHDTLAEAKREAECAIEHFSERLADQLSDPRSDGNFQDVGYGVVLAQSAYSIDHIVTQDDIDNGDYSYEVGTEIMSLFLAEAQEQSHEHS